MEIIVKGRQTSVAQRFRDFADDKLAKVQKLDPKVMRIDVEVSKERNPRLADRRERVELTCHTRGPAIRAEAAADDRYTALEHALARLKERLRKGRDRRKIHHGSHTPQSLAEATANGFVGAGAPSSNVTSASGVGADDSTMEGAAREAVADSAVHISAGDDPDQAVVPLETYGDAPLVVREKRHRARPMTLDQALFEMELVGHDFFLFRDRDSGLPSVVYRRKGFDYGVLRLEE